MGNRTQSEEGGKAGKAFCASFCMKCGLVGVISVDSSSQCLIVNTPCFPGHSNCYSASLVET